MFGAVADNLLIGIVGSLIATVIVFLVTQLREHIRHQKRIKSANLFVIDRLRAYIVNADIPTDDILNALRKSAARKFELREYELWPISIYVEEIVAEIIGNVYLKMEQQTAYLKKANEYLAKHSMQINTSPLQRQSDKIYLQWRIISLFILFITFLAFYVFVIVFDILIYNLAMMVLINHNVHTSAHYNVPLFSKIAAIAIVATLFLIIGIIICPKIKSKIMSTLQKKS